MQATPAAAAALAAVCVGVFADGGYSPGARIAFGVAALLAVALARPRRLPAVAVVLLALAALGALSALWTIGPVDRTLIWALVTAGYAAIALAATRLAPVVAATAIGVIAALAAVIGLGAVALHEFPQAEEVAGVWRPGGPFEYAPALAALQVAALPVFLEGMLRGRRRAVAGASALAVALAGGVVALSASRMALALALAVGGLALTFPRAPRPRIAAALALGAIAGAAIALVPGPVTIVAAAILAPAAWLVLPERRGAPGIPKPKVALAVLVASLVAGSVAFGAAPNRGVGAESGFLHGRTDTWRAAIETFADRPLHGTGADAFLAGSARHQRGQTIVFAHDLPLEFAAELGIAGALLAIALYVTTATTFRHARRDPHTLWLLGPAVAVFPLTSLVDWQWHLAGAGAVWALAVGAMAGNRRPGGHDP